MYTVFVDGACKPNPGKGSYGFVVYNKVKQEIYRENGSVGNYVTNNIAEYTAVIKALECDIINGVQELQVFSDSELVVKQLNGEYQVSNPEMKKLHKKVCKLTDNYRSVTFSHIPRTKNKIADSLANQVFVDTDTRRAKAEGIASKVFIKTATGYLYVKDNAIYVVDPVNLTCTCPDKSNRGGLCKHLMAAQILESKLEKTLQLA